MNRIINNIFYLPINDDFLVYSPLNGMSAFVNRLGVLELQKQLHLHKDNRGNPKSKLYELARELFQSPARFPLRKTGNLNPDFLGIIPTRACNGACNYCDFGAETAPMDKMSYKLAADIVDWYADLLKAQNRDILEIHFFGGEPMIATDLIEVIVHRARLVSQKFNFTPYFEISTNGQYNKTDAKLLCDYFNKVVLSLDGFKEIQNKHRPLKSGKSSFENVMETAKIISNSNAELCIRCCVSQDNVSQMEEITRWLCENFRLTAINYEILCASSLTQSKGLYPPDPIDFSLHFQKSREIADLYGIDVVYASDISDQIQVSSCPVGKDTVIVSPDGRISNCYLMQQRWQEVGLCLDFGFIYSQDKIEIDQMKLERIRAMVENKPRCESCFCQWSCAGGCHVGNTFPGCDLEYDNFCQQTRLISAFTLLSKLGLTEQIDILLNNQKALNRILSLESDRLSSYISEKID